MSTDPSGTGRARDGDLRIARIVRFWHRAGPAHCLVRAARTAPDRRAAVLVSEIAGNPDDRGTTADFGKVADAVLPLLPRGFARDPREIVWIAHFGEFSYHDPAGPDSFTRIALSWADGSFVDDRAGDVRIGRAAAENLMGGWLRPVSEVLSDLGYRG